MKPYRYVEDQTFQHVLVKPSDFLPKKLIETNQIGYLFTEELVETNHYGNLFNEELVETNHYGN
jgi:hypothetical protein